MGAFLREPAPLVRLVCLAKIWVGFFFQGFSANWGFLEQGFGGSTPEGWGGGIWVVFKMGGWVYSRDAQGQTANLWST